MAAMTETGDREEEGDNTLEVKVYGNDVEKALKILKRNLSKEGFFREMRERKHYEKPSVKKKRKQVAARRNKRRMERMRSAY